MGFRKARLSAGLTVMQVVEALKVSDAAVYQWETGVTHPSTKRLFEIAKLYGCTIEELLAPDPDET
jgi:transcriptional regulator with XRE-family HTH domain